jgi:hypothetical protein
MQLAWFIALVSTICLEGLGRKYLPQMPTVAFYFAKDVVLVIGVLMHRPTRDVTRLGSYLYRGFKVAWVVAAIWTVGQILNPEHQSIALGFVGLRAYWLWWIAPFVIASALEREKNKRRAVYVLLVFATGIAAFASAQFAAPPDSALNLYSVVDGQELYASDSTVHATGRARVSSTFSYISGFSAFTMLVPALLLSIGLDARDRKLRRLTLIVTCITAAVVPMSGSRASVITGATILVVATWTAGLFVTRIGRRVMVGGLAAAVFAVVAFPEAFTGVQSRFDDTEETNTRYILNVASVLPPVALTIFDYPAFGIGTGMMQNARISMRIRTDWDAEAEAQRLLIELGPVGYLVMWATKVGLVVALLRAYVMLKRAGRRGASAAAMSYVVLTLVGTLPFDHIWQALYFMGCGFILAEVVAVAREAQASAAAARALAATPEPVPAVALVPEAAR